MANCVHIEVAWVSWKMELEESGEQEVPPWRRIDSSSSTDEESNFQHQWPFNPETSAKVLRIQRSEYKAWPWETRGFWPKDDVAEDRFPSEEALVYPGEVCLLEDCRKPLRLHQEGRECSRVWIVGETAAFMRK